MEGNPYDGHTLKATLDQVSALTGVEPQRVYVDRGFRGHDDAYKERVFIAAVISSSAQPDTSHEL